MSTLRRDEAPPRDTVFEDLRPLLFAIAYRMLGSAAEAEDVVQEAFLRFHREADAVDDPKAFLTTVLTRLAIDHLRSARKRREVYTGPWLPEPLVGDPGPAETVERMESLSLAFLVVLEALTPLERAVFVLREIFGYGYDEIATILDRSEENCRQLNARAKRHVDERRPRYEPDPHRQRELVDRFVTACVDGDADALVAMLQEDAVAYTDGGGKARAAPRPLEGARAISRFMTLIATPERRGDAELRAGDVNGRPGQLFAAPDGSMVAVLDLEVGEDGRIRAVRIVNNPDKLRGIRPPATP